jgi:PleD family two-component response regulator
VAVQDRLHKFAMYGPNCLLSGRTKQQFGPMYKSEQFRTDRGSLAEYGIHESHMSSNRSRVLIADDHNLVAELCKRLLEPEFQVVGTVSNGRDLLRAAAKLKPDVIVVDIAMPVLNGLDAGNR